MLKILWQLLVVGFPPKCVHDFGLWNIVNSLSGDDGSVIVHQARRCQKCGVCEFKVDKNG